MPFTVANLHAALVSGLGGKLAFVGKSVVADGTNADLVTPVATALALIGYPPDNYAAPSDDDLARVPARRVSDLLGLSRLFALQEIWGCMTDVNESQVDRSQSWSSLSAEIQSEIARLEGRYKALLISHGGLATGTIRIPGHRGSHREF